MAIWRRITEVALGDGPPPLRPFYPGFDNLVPTNDPLVVWVKTRYITTLTLTGHAPSVYDSGWLDAMQLAAFTWPLVNVASHNSASTLTSQVMIKTGGRKMPWQIVTEETTTSTPDSGPTTTSTSLVTIDIVPGSEQTFDYTIGGPNKSLSINRIMINIPAEGPV